MYVYIGHFQLHRTGPGRGGACTTWGGAIRRNSVGIPAECQKTAISHSGRNKSARILFRRNFVGISSEFRRNFLALIGAQNRNNDKIHIPVGIRSHFSIPAEFRRNEKPLRRNSGGMAPINLGRISHFRRSEKTFRRNSGGVFFSSAGISAEWTANRAFHSSGIPAELPRGWALGNSGGIAQRCCPLPFTVGQACARTPQVRIITFATGL